MDRAKRETGGGAVAGCGALAGAGPGVPASFFAAVPTRQPLRGCHPPLQGRESALPASPEERCVNLEGLGPGIHDFAGAGRRIPAEVVGGRAKPGHDG